MRHSAPTFRQDASRPQKSQWLSWLITLGAWLMMSCAAEMGAPDLECSDGRIDCGECTDTTANLLHCGTCGSECSAGEDCIDGACLCVAGLDACPSGCVNVLEDPNNCGTCGNVCDAGLVCSSGTCASGCAFGQTACGASCVDLGSSVFHCGACATPCGAGQSCAAGVCGCTQGRIDCGDGCVDTLQEVLHCGQCGMACASDEICAEGVCQHINTGAGGTFSSGGSGTGGVSAGGTHSGGTSSGGASTGGASSGGATGGTNTGGAGTGGAPDSCNRTGFYVSGKKLYDKNCSEFVMRGINYPYAWFSDRNISQDFAAIANAGANTVRIVMATGARWTKTSAANITSIVNAAKAAKLVSVVEVHDTTGYSEQSGSVAISNATSYWSESAIKAALTGQEAYVILNIANEPNGNNTTNSWASSHVTSVQALRNAGYAHTLMIDAPNWGQDWSNTMRGGAGSSIWDADSAKNLVFSVHMYDVYGTSSSVSTYMNTFINNYSAPLVVGEFASDHGSSGNVDEDAIMSFAETLGVGYLGWSWSGNSSDLSSLDMTNGFNPSSLTTWGNRLINGANGLKQTSEMCSCFN